MTFLALIIAVLLLQVWGSGDSLHNDAWYYRWQSRVAGFGLSARVVLVFSVLGPTLLAGWLLDALHGILFGLPWIAAATCLLLYAFGRGDFQALIQRYLGYCQAQDFQSAFHFSDTELPREHLENEGDPEATEDTPLELHNSVQKQLLYEGFQRWFAVLFYFVLLGPAAGLGYRLLHLSHEQQASKLSRQLLFYVDWVPVRLLAAAFVLTGDFMRSRDVLLVHAADTAVVAPVVLYDVASAALGQQMLTMESFEADNTSAAYEQTEAFAALLSRSSATWLVGISLVVLLL